jgi:hypothetical protein
MELKVKKFDAELQIVYGEVYAPNVVDSQGDFMEPDEIRKMAHGFLKDMNIDQVDKNHDHELTGSHVVESFIARKGDPTFIEDSWVVGVHVPDSNLWDQIKKGELNGFSLEAKVKRVDKELEIEVPEHVVGKTEDVGGHTHVFKVHFDEEGNFQGGQTDVVNGHYHKIARGAATEEAAGHTHRFSFVEEFI